MYAPHKAGYPILIWDDGLIFDSIVDKWLIKRGHPAGGGWREEEGRRIEAARECALKFKEPAPMNPAEFAGILRALFGGKAA